MSLSDGCGGLLILLAASWTVKQAASPPDRCATPWAWRLLVLGAVICLRWPQLVASNDFSPDESQSLAGALTLIHDPRFWLSVDGATAGPLHFYALIPAVWLPTPAPYFWARLFAIGAVLGMTFAAGAMVRRWTAPVIEQVAILPAAAAYGLSRMPDLQMFSTELVPALSVFVALWLAFTSRPDQLRQRRRVVVMGILLGLTPLAKLQVAPTALVAGLFIARELVTVSARAIGTLIVAALLPTLLTMIYLSVTGAWDRAIIPYLLNNIAYVQGEPLHWSALLGTFVQEIVEDTYTAAWIAAAVIVGVVTTLLARGRGVARPQLGWTVAGVGLTSILCVLLPHRPYPHYLYLLLGPSLLFFAWVLARGHDALATVSRPRRMAAIGAVLAVLLIPLAGLRLSHSNNYAWLSWLFGRWHRENEEMAGIIKPFQRPDDALAIWGSRSDLYVTTRLRQAIPEAHTQTQITPGPWQHYFLGTYAQDFRRANAAIFVDAVGSENFLFENRAVAHEAFPALDEMVRANYTLVAEIHTTRIYIRNDRYTRHAPP